MRRLLPTTLLAALALAFAFGCRSTDWPLFPGPETNDDLRQTLDIVYYDGPGSDRVRNSLDIYSPKCRADSPTLIIVHGGEWKYGDNRCFGLYSSVGRAFASRGFTVVMPNYRLTPWVKHPEHAKDVARAIAWTKQKIAKHGGDPSAIFLMGHSAGGHLVSLLATDDRYLKAEGMSPEDIKGVISVSGVYRITPGRFEVHLGGESSLALGIDQMLPIRGDTLPVNPLLKQGPPLTIDVFGPVFGPDPKAREAASPITYVRPGLPKFLVVSGESDLPALAAQADEFHDALTKAEVPSTRLHVKNRNHNSIMFRAAEPNDPVAEAAVALIRGK